MSRRSVLRHAETWHEGAYQVSPDPHNRHTWLAHDDDTGTQVGRLAVEPDPEGPWIADLRVHPEHQRQGVGRALWEAAGRPAHTPDIWTPEGEAFARGVGGDFVHDDGLRGKLQEPRKKSGILRQREIDAIFREAAPAIGVMPVATAPELPDHDYLQHHLGDDEDWGIQRTAGGALNPHLPWDPPDTSVPAHTYLHPDEVMGYARDDNEWRNVDNFHGLAKDLQANGMQEPIYVGTNGVHAEIQDGHHRAQVAQSLGWDKVPVHVVDDPYMDELDDDKAVGPGLASYLKSRTAADLTPPQPIDMSSDLTYNKPAPGSSHGAEIHNGSDGTQWLVKKAPSHAQSMVDMDVAANRIATHSGLEAPATFKTTTPDGGVASAQQMYPNAKDAYPGKAPINPETIPDDDLLTFQKHHALDWMLGNHDDHNRNFIRTQDGKMVGVDKGQAMKFINNDRLHWDFFPNEHEPVHNTLYRNMAQGGRILNDPRVGELGKYISGLQDIPDEDYQNMLRPYAEKAAQEGKLAKDWKAAGYTPHHGGDLTMADARMAPNDPEAFLNVATQRKNTLMQDFGKLYDRAMAHHKTGTGIA